MVDLCLRVRQIMVLIVLLAYLVTFPQRVGQNANWDAEED